MLIGILSDSHGRYRAVRQAMALFDRLGVSHVVHCGDVGAEGVFEEMVGCPCTFVWGNMDSPYGQLSPYLRTLDIEEPNAIPRMLTLESKTLAVFHGHEPGFDTALDTLDVDYILHGHTHVMRDERRGRRRIINPGALSRSERKTVATLDPATDELTFHEVSDGSEVRLYRKA